VLIGGARLEHPAAPLGDLLRLGLAARPGEVALLSNRRALTWSELEEASEEVVFLDEMPLNPTGKIDRVGLKRMAEEHLHPHGL
jgi:hypothetical protein